MRNLLRCPFLIAALLASAVATAQGFQSEKLKRASEVLGISAQIDSLPTGQSTDVKANDGLIVSVRVSPAQVVEHIGIPLFNADMRTLMPSPVYDFLEFAVLNWKYKFNPNTLYLSKVIFKKGSWNSLLTGRLSEADCAIENRDDRLYVVTWQREGKDVTVVGIPIEYELLNNDSRRNMERDFVSQLADHVVPPADVLPAPVREEDLKIYGTEGLFILQGQCHILPELNQNVYYTLKTVREEVDTVWHNKPTTMTFEAVVPAIVSDREHPAETLANLMLAQSSELPDALLNLDFHLSDYHRQQLAVPVRQLSDFFRQQGCTLYFASSGIVDGNVRGMLFVTNAAKGYNHLLSLTIPEDQLTAARPQVQAAVYLYIPPIDESHLFGKTPTKKSGAKIY